MEYNYIVINTDSYSDYGQLEQSLNYKGKKGYHIVATIGRLIILEREEKVIREEEKK